MNKCVTEVRHQYKVLKENKCSVLINNPNKKLYRLVAVDGCEITGDAERCDYLVLFDEQARYIELKGADTKKALSQLYASFAKLKAKFPANEIHFIVVSTKAPAIGNFQKKAKSLKKLMGGNFKLLLKCRKAELELGIADQG